jgi:hypothetical protein
LGDEIGMGLKGIHAAAAALCWRKPSSG